MGVGGRMEIVVEDREEGWRWRMEMWIGDSREREEVKGEGWVGTR